MDYTDRICAPDETLRRVTPHLDSFGVTRLSRLTGLDRIGIPVWNAVAPNSRSIVINQGKGITDLDAKVSAAMEALERAVACAPQVTAVTATPAELAACGKRALCLPSLIAAGQPDIDPDEAIDWIEGVDLFAGGGVFVPLGAATLDRSIRGNRFWQTSDGLASGNHFEEAALHGLLERIERDADVLWRMASFGTRMTKCVTPRSFNDPVLDDLLDRIELAGLAVRAFDVTSDIGVPCFVVLLAPSDILALRTPRFVDVTSGQGCHPSATRAMIRAVTEAAQSRLTYISGARDDVFPETFARPLPQELQDCFRADPRPAPDRSGPLSGDPKTLLDQVLLDLERAGIDTVVAVRLSAESLPFAVVKVFAPDLENPDGERKRRFGARALSSSLMTS
ncbi:ribosomal protein S12 methylthiotransferase accessory factor [Hoeflea marina]|uniref:Ribosomal protein S12 methylthiotransferase accessory factor n=1 Tax=Hoeflea marina TaxID=274592 RepID=A0A317PQ31_9HYPH|nr:YcaO-like family protein [Hoeflea marina]PWW03563.1 ribosomal protein S12 methylthiotransferase accessory factor [Hoeflea marina]